MIDLTVAPAEILSADPKILMFQIGLALAVVFTAIVSVWSFGQYLWSVIDDCRWENNPILLYLDSKGLGDKSLYMAFLPWISMSFILGCLPIIGFICFQVYPVVLAIGIGTGLVFLARFSRRLFKRFNKHEKNTSIHQKR